MKFRRISTVLALGFICLIPLKAQSQVSFLRSVTKQELLQTGKEAYKNRCAGCHGMNGDAKTPTAKMLDPKPRDFTKGIYKLKSTHIGSQPTNADLMQVLDRGIPGTSMPSFILVSQAEKMAIIEYIKAFSPEAWKEQDDSKIVPSLALPEGVFHNKAKFIEFAKRGRAWYQELGCASCHGNTGLGNGPAAQDLVDNWGNKIRPANLTNRTIKRGATVHDVAKSISLGVDGTPMPAHLDILESLDERFPEIAKKQHIWDLTAYVFYLRGLKAGMYDGEIAAIPESGIPAEEVAEVIGKYLQ